MSSWSGKTSNSTSGKARWIFWSLAPALLLSWIFSGCGKDSTIQISKNEVAQSYPLNGIPASSLGVSQRRVRVELKFEGAEMDPKSYGSVKLENGTTVLDHNGDKDIFVAEGEKIVLTANPTRGWKVKKWEFFPGVTRNSSTVFLGKRLQMAEAHEDQYVTLYLEPKADVKFAVRVAGPEYHGGTHSYSGVVKWTAHVPRNTTVRSYHWSTYGQCHVLGSDHSLSASKCEPMMFPYGTRLEMEIIKRGGSHDSRNYVLLDDDVSLDFTFTEEGGLTVSGDVDRLKVYKKP